MKLNKKLVFYFFIIVNLLFCDIKFIRLEFEKYQEKKIQENGEILEIPKIEYQTEEDLIKELKENGVKIENFTIWPTGKTPRMKTECFMGYTNEGFCFYLKTEKDEKYSLKARRFEVEETKLWYDDNFEIFLYPVEFESIYYQIIVNPLGEKYDCMWLVKEEIDPIAASPTIKKEKKANVEWDSKSKIKIEIKKNYWVCLLIIPFNSLGYDIAPYSSLWKVNICRSYRETDDLVQWAITEKGFHELEKFKLVKIGKEKDIKIEFEIPLIGYGENVLKVKYENNKKSDIEGNLKVEVKKEEKKIYEEEKKVILKKGRGEEKIAIPILLKEEGFLNCILKIEDDVFYYKKFLSIPCRIIKSSMEKTIFLYEKEKQIEGKIILKLGESSIEKSYLKFELEKEGIKEEKEIKLKGNLLTFNLDTLNLNKGQYILRIYLIEDGKIIDTYETKIFVISPFKF